MYKRNGCANGGAAERGVAMHYELSDAANLLQGQPMFQILARIKEMERAGERVIHFEIGDPDFPTPQNIINAAADALNSGYTHYADSMGDHAFRKAIAENNLRTRGFCPKLSQVLVAPGANMLVYYAVRCLVNPGDEVIVQDPCFPTYLSVFHFCGVKPVGVPLYEKNGFRLDPADLEARVTDRTRLIILNSPHNPTGAVMRREELEAVGRIALERGIYLYSDEIYARMDYGDTPFYSPSALDQCRERVIVANGFSKAFAMTGWRLGVGIGPEKVVEKMGLLLQTTSSCVPPFVQKAGMEAVEGSQEAVRNMMAEYKERRDILVRGLNEIKGVQCLCPGGAFYVFPNIAKTGLSSRQFAYQLLERGKVGVCAGSDFGKCGEGYVRLCYAASREDIAEGIRRVRGFVESLEG